MKFFYIFLFLIPNIIYPYFAYEDCRKITHRIEKEWIHHQECIERFLKLSPEEQPQGIELLKEAIAYCDKAIQLNHRILRKIAKKSKDDRKDPWWILAKKTCEESIGSLQAEIASLENAIHTVLANAALQKTQLFFNKSEHQISLAEIEAKMCPEPFEHNLQQVLSILETVIRLYEEALANARLALSALEAGPTPNSQDRNLILQRMEYCQDLIRQYREISENLLTKSWEPSEELLMIEADPTCAD